MIDAVAILLVILAAVFMHYRATTFSVSVSQRTQEPANYTVIVKSLPGNADALQVADPIPWRPFSG